MLAASNGRAVLLRRLLAHGGNVNAQTRTGWTALTGAAWNGHPNIVRQLLDAGANSALLDRTGRTALQYATLRAANPTNPSAGNAGAAPAVLHGRYVEVIDILSKAR
jgi:ankyrin repeat protein